MISREELRQLASFECQCSNELAISFYFQPGTPQDKSHREEAILAKDMVRKTLQELQLNGRNRDATEDLERILHLETRREPKLCLHAPAAVCGANSTFRPCPHPPSCLSTAGSI